jgi:hypothetical protein
LPLLFDSGLISDAINDIEISEGEIDGTTVFDMKVVLTGLRVIFIQKSHGQIDIVIIQILVSCGQNLICRRKPGLILCFADAQICVQVFRVRTPGSCQASTN